MTIITLIITMPLITAKTLTATVPIMATTTIINY